MKDVLDEIIAWKRIEVAKSKEIVSPPALYKRWKQCSILTLDQ